MFVWGLPACLGWKTNSVSSNWNTIGHGPTSTQTSKSEIDPEYPHQGSASDGGDSSVHGTAQELTIYTCYDFGLWLDKTGFLCGDCSGGDSGGGGGDSGGGGGGGS
ncbi:hypothetical protein PTTG_00093 [Puccinia triticina 1-1 BBBD Race 1]|uniref:Uncharacterized protein n=1 Tax=Puccinia triticina (isolate 1-1 / race 1 (BBBD)) TaxID=630390 RepID=A0A0C4EH77_PUCT1|nr:hypothetical protein PTTG_00093 [Puccinia triticina 1-1 BBBD Race 1]